MNRFSSVIVQRDTSWKLSWKIKCLSNVINLCRDPPLWTVDPFYTTTDVLLHLFTVRPSVIYSLFTLAIMMQMLFFWGGGLENAWKKPQDTLSDSISQEQTATRHKRRQHLHKLMFKLRIHTTSSSARGEHSENTAIQVILSFVHALICISKEIFILRSNSKHIQHTVSLLWTAA